MPPTALSTTKRKFHKLLDSLASNASTTSLPPPNTSSSSNNSSSVTLATTTHDPTSAASKRPRTTTLTNTPRRPVSAYTPRPAGMAPSTTTTTTSSTRPTSIALAQTQPQKTPSGSHKTPPQYAPWDRDAFLTRLQTFRFVDKWRAKPLRISEVEWAKRGWSCVGVERVGCAGCGGGVVVVLAGEGRGKGQRDGDHEEGGGEGEGEGEEGDGEDWRKDAQEELVGRYEEMIRTGHAEGCLWRRRGCDDLIQRVPVVRLADAVEGLRGRYKGLAGMGEELPREVTVPGGVDVGRVLEVARGVLVVEKSSSASSGSEEMVTGAERAGSGVEVNPSAFLLALFGWQAEEDHIAGLATCKACFRRLGLWLFKSAESSMERLDVVSEHREYCPWINALSQNGVSRRSSLDGLAGWEMLLRTVSTRAAVREPLGEIANGAAGKEGSEAGNDNDDGRMGETASLIGSLAEDQEKNRDERDKERWAKLKKLKQVFQVKKRPGTSGTNRSVATVSSDVV